MKRVLIINTIGMGYEGISSVITNYISHMDRSDLSIEFTAQPTVKKEFRNKLEALGTVVILPDRKKDFRGYILGLNRLLKKNSYNILHVHGNSSTMTIEAFLGRVHHVDKIIVHTHNTRCDHPFINKLLVPIMKFCATDLLACSEAAGIWLYGKSRYIVLNNAIDIESFRFDEISRQAYRKEFEIENTYIIGHVGNFLTQKNHDYLIDIFSEYFKINNNARLLLLGDGELVGTIKKKVIALGLEEAVIFCGRRSDINRIYSTMDMFILPSLWEGLPVVLIEAQASGLPILASSNITKEAKCTNSLFYKSLQNSAKSWAEEIERIRNLNIARTNYTKDIGLSGFDINIESKKLKKIYVS